VVPALNAETFIHRHSGLMIYQGLYSSIDNLVLVANKKAASCLGSFMDF
jgi:hypothetical protein